MSASLGPNLIEDGLILSLDSADKNSYSGSGSSWVDASNNANTFTLVGSPPYSNNIFTFNGSSQYASISTASGFFNSSGNSFYADAAYAWTISVWFKFPVSPTPCPVKLSTINPFLNLSKPSASCICKDCACVSNKDNCV